MRFLVVQIGARRSYAVPALLQNAGLLDRFYTDLTADIGLGKWLVKCGPLLGFKNPSRKLAARQLPESIRAKTTTFARPGFWFACNRALCRNDPASRFREQLRWGQHLGLAMIRHGFGNATHLYSMLGECAPILAQAKRRGLTTVTEMYIALSTERILKSEHAMFPDWEETQPDFDDVRAQFPDHLAILSNTDLSLCPSQTVRRDLVENFGFPQSRTDVVPYGVDQTWLSVASQPEIGRILFVGTAGLRKGIHYLAMAAELLRARGRNYQFRVVGDVQPQTAQHSACRHLLFLGRLGREPLRAEYALADLFVLPSLAEGSAEASYEALAAGLPVIATAAAGTVVRDGIDGRIIPERDPGSLAQAIERIVEKRLLRATMAAAARHRAREFTLQQYGQRLASALRGFGT